MSKNPTRSSHRAPRRPWWSRGKSRPSCGPIPVLPPIPVHEAPDLDLPSMDLPEDHMPQRPYDTVVLDVVTVPGAAIGAWRAAPVRTLEDYRVGDEVTVIAEDDPHTGRKAWVETIAYASHRRQIGVRVLTDLGGLARLIEWYDVAELEPDPRAAETADTVVLDAVDAEPSDADDVVLMGGAR